MKGLVGGPSLVGGLGPGPPGPPLKSGPASETIKSTTACQLNEISCLMQKSTT